MNKRISSVLMLIIFIILLFVSVIPFYATFNSYTEVKKVEEEYSEKKVALEENISNEKAALDTAGKNFLLDNVKIAEKVLELQGCNLIAITAQTVIDGKLSDIVSVSTIEDVSYFTESVEYMQFNFNVSDYATFMGSIKESSIVWEYVSVDINASTAILRVAAAEGTGRAYESADTVNSVPVEQVDTNEASDTVTQIPEQAPTDKDNTLGGALEQNDATEAGAVSGGNTDIGGDE